MANLWQVLRERFGLGSVTASPSHRWNDIEVRPAASQAEVEALVRLLAMHETHDNFVPLPKRLPEVKDVIHPVLVGAWHDSDLVGAVWAGCSEQEADAPRIHGFDEDADAILKHVAAIHSIAVVPHARRHGVALALTGWVNAWAYEHDADAIIAIPMTEASGYLLQEAGYHVLDPGVTLIMQIKGAKRPYGFPSDESTRWGVRICRQAGQATVIVRVEASGSNAYRRNQKLRVSDVLKPL